MTVLAELRFTAIPAPCLILIFPKERSIIVGLVAGVEVAREIDVGATELMSVEFRISYFIRSLIYRAFAFTSCCTALFTPVSIAFHANGTSADKTIVKIATYRIN